MTTGLTGAAGNMNVINLARVRPAPHTLSTKLFGDENMRFLAFERVVSKKCLPALRGRRPTSHHVFGDRRLGNLEPQHQEFAMGSRRAPLRVFLAHPLDEITQAMIDLRAPCPLPGFPAPESFEAARCHRRMVSG